MTQQNNLIPDSIKKEYSFANHFIEIEGNRMHYLDEGSGEVVILLHGNPSWSFLYRNLIKKLSPSMRCIAPDHMGCGLSDKPQDYDYCLKNHIKNIEILIERLGIKSYHLVVHDWGGMIGMGVSVNNADRVNKIVVLNTAAFLLKRIPLRINICRIPILGEIIIRGFNGFAGMALYMAVKNKMPDVVKSGFVMPYNNWKNRIATHRFVRDIPMNSSHRSYDTAKHIDDSLTNLSEKQMMLCWGGDDFCFNDLFYEEWKRRFPNAKLNYHRNAGHYVLEDLNEAEINEIASFLVS
jgi:cis-3-alkyl-4-acyloxetan-2-one decarboxylase